MKKDVLSSIFQYVVVFVWACILLKTDSYFSIYLLLAIAGVLAIKTNSQKASSTTNTNLENIFASVLSLFIVAANYSMYQNYFDGNGIWMLFRIVLATLTFLGGFIIFKNILLTINAYHLPTKKPTKKSTRFFWILFLIISAAYLLIFFTSFYPGTLTEDSINEVGQMLSGQYSNHHPFFYTILVQLFVGIGTNLFNDINLGISFFIVFQILLFAITFTYMAKTLFEIGISKKFLSFFFLALLLLPYNIFYSFTMWKDILFAIFFTLFIISTYRYLKPISNNLPTLLIIIISALAVCLFRSNGLFAFIIATVTFPIIFCKQHLKLFFTFCGIIIVALILKGPVLKALNVSQPDRVESLSIPMQQISRVIVEKNDEISEDDRKTIENVISLDDVIAHYNPIIHDPIKNTIREHGDQDYINEHFLDFVFLYLRWGIKYPMLYVNAWIDQTRGYWNGGYDYWIWRDVVTDNDYSIEKKSVLPFVNKVIGAYGEMFKNLGFLQPLISIGLAVWALFFIIYRSIKHHDKLMIFIVSPLFTTWLSLLIATPVFCEFRYIYYLFLTLPFILMISLTNKPSKNVKTLKALSSKS